MKRQRQAVYFAGCTASFIDTDIGKSTIRLLEKFGYQTVLPDLECCGLPHLANGQIDTFRKLANLNIRELMHIDGPIVSACTSCSLTLKHHVPNLIGTPQAGQVAGRTYDIIDFLAQEGVFDTLATSVQSTYRSAAYHAPCHLKAAGNLAMDSRRKLLKRIPGLKVDSIDRGCCGMGGTYGLKTRSFQASISIGQDLFEAIEASDTELVITDCPACKMQIEHGTGRKVSHPIIVLEQALQALHKQLPRRDKCHELETY